MSVLDELNREFDRQAYNSMGEKSVDADKYCQIAAGYAEVEQVLAVLSNLVCRESMVFYGRFSERLDINGARGNERIPSIWEEEILQTIHPDDLEGKWVNELLFFHHVNHLPTGLRFNYCLMQQLRMRGTDGEWVHVLHRLFYIPSPDRKTLLFALCLYGPLKKGFEENCIVMDTVTGDTFLLDGSAGSRILTRQEIEVLKLINNGYRSKGIAEALHISVHTVSRHRQNIIAKLKVRNSVEACKIARNLSII